MKEWLIIRPADTVAVALAPLKAGTQAAGVRLREDVPQGHKFAREDIPAGAPVVKYGAPIGRATADIPAGSCAPMPVRSSVSPSPVPSWWWASSAAAPTA